MRSTIGLTGSVAALSIQMRSPDFKSAVLDASASGFPPRGLIEVLAAVVVAVELVRRPPAPADHSSRRG